MRPAKYSDEIAIPEGVSVSFENSIMSVTGPKGNLSRKMQAYNVDVSIKDGKVTFSSVKPSKNEKRMIGTFTSHVKNMIKGVVKGYTYKLKISSGHFPIAAVVKNDHVEVKNFFGERKARTAKILEHVNVKIEGEIIKVTGIDLEKVSQTAANIEQSTRISNRDKRVFMDRINIIVKDES